MRARPVRRVVDRSWSHLSRRTASSSLDLEILSYVFFLILLGTTFLL